MRLKPPLRLEVEKPLHGWAVTTVTLGDQTVVITASNVGPDSFALLASCALFALQAQDSNREAAFLEEPGGLILGVRPRGDGNVDVTMYRTPDLGSANAERELVASVATSAVALGAAIWRGLRAHERLLIEAHAAGDWGPFPVREVQLLGQILRERRVES